MSKSVEIALFKFADHSEEPKSLEECRAIVQDVFAPWMAAESDGKLTLAAPGLTDWQTLPQPMSFYGPVVNDPVDGPFLAIGAANAILTDHARALLPYTLQSRDLVVMVFNRGQGAAAGNPQILTGCWPGKVGLSLGTLRHESGHVLGGLHEAGSWSPPQGSNLHVCEDTSDLTADGCTWGKYDDIWEAMGAGEGPERHYSTYNRDRFGWQVPANITEALATRPVSLWRSDVPPVPGQSASQVQELRVPLTAAGPYFYTVEYRPAHGVFVRMVDPTHAVSGVGTFIVNRGNPLQVGQAFDDTFRDIHITHVNVIGDYATVQVHRTAISGGGGGGGGWQEPD